MQTLAYALHEALTLSVAPHLRGCIPLSPIARAILHNIITKTSTKYGMWNLHIIGGNFCPSFYYHDEIFNKQLEKGKENVQAALDQLSYYKGHVMKACSTNSTARKVALLLASYFPLNHHK